MANNKTTIINLYSRISAIEYRLQVTEDEDEYKALENSLRVEKERLAKIENSRIILPIDN